jgi:diguanylate cyclase (GGDEF)-like protein
VKALKDWWSRRLWRRIAVISVGLLLLVQVVVFGLVQRSVPGLVQMLGAQDLDRGEQVWLELLNSRASVRERQLELQADDGGLNRALIAAAEENDPDTARSAIENAASRLAATRSALLSETLEPRFLGENTAEADLQHLLPAVKVLIEGLRPTPLRRSASQLMLIGDEPSLLVVSRMRGGAGVLVAGVPLSADIPRVMQKTALMEVALLVRRPGQAPQVALSSVSTAESDELLALAPDSRTVMLPKGKHLLRRFAPVQGPYGGMETLLLTPVSRIEKPFDELTLPLLAASALGVLLALLGSLFTARRVTTPLNDLAIATRRLGQGDFDVPVPLPRHRDEVGELARAVDVMRENIRAKQAEIRDLAYTDRLTGLPNRVSFADGLRRAIDETRRTATGAAEPAGFSTVMLGLDRFKNINENLGYTLGDEVLREVALRLRRHVQRDGDVVARLAGDQFALLLSGADLQRASAVIDGICAAFVHPIVVQGETVDVSLTFGVAAWPQHAPDVPEAPEPAGREQAEVLLARAEMAMHAAKRGKSAHMAVYDPGIDAGSQKTLTLLSELRHAIGAHELRLFLQPKIDVATNGLVGAEALVRWQHPVRGMVPPGQFIPFAEDTGFVRQLTLWVFEEAARQWAALHALGLHRLSVNLSTRDLLDPELPTRFDAILRRQGVPATAFCLEITESAVMNEPKRALAMLNTLAAAGFELSIDDYGEGQTSLSYLKTLPVHELKIDQIFIKQIDRDEKDATIVRSTIGLAHSLGFRAVAEGVENAAILVLLRELGCDEAQGFHLARPMPAAEMAAWARQRAGLPAVAAAAADTVAA